MRTEEKIAAQVTRVPRRRVTSKRGAMRARPTQAQILGRTILSSILSPASTRGEIVTIKGVSTDKNCLRQSQKLEKQTIPGLRTPPVNELPTVPHELKRSEEHT